MVWENTYFRTKKHPNRMFSLKAFTIYRFVIGWIYLCAYHQFHLYKLYFFIFLFYLNFLLSLNSLLIFIKKLNNISNTIDSIPTYMMFNPFDIIIDFIFIHANNF